jgi:hypothetical protein
MRLSNLAFSIALCFWASHIATAQVAMTDSTQVSADHTEVTGQMVYYSGHVRIRSGNLVIHADGFEWNPEAKEGRIHGAARVVVLEKATAKRPDDTRERLLERRFRPQVTLPEIMPPG